MKRTAKYYSNAARIFTELAEDCKPADDSPYKNNENLIVYHLRTAGRIRPKYRRAQGHPGGERVKHSEIFDKLAKDCIDKSDIPGQDKSLWSLAAAVYSVAGQIALTREESNRQKTYCAKCGQGFTDMGELTEHLEKCFT